MKSGLPVVDKKLTHSRGSSSVQHPAALLANFFAGAVTQLSKRDFRAHPLRAVVAPHLLSVLDQGIVSAAQFLTIVAIARYASASDLGAYSIASSLLVSAVAVQESLISLPYMIQRDNPIGTPAEHAGCSLMQHFLLSISAAFALNVIALVLIESGARPVLAAVAWTLSAVMPFRLLREFGRQFAFAHLQMARALMLDLGMAVLQLGGMCLLAFTGHMSTVSALLALGAAYAPVGILGIYLDRADLAIRLDRLQATIRQSWGLGKWLVAGQMTVWMQVSVANWALALIIDAEATGVYAASMSIVQFASPAISGFCNILTPKAVTAFKHGGLVGLRQHAIQSALLLGAALVLFCTLIMLFGEDMVRLLYHGREYEGQGPTVTVLALALLASSVGIPASNALASMERPRAIVLVGLGGAALTVVLVSCMTIRWGLLGAAFGFLSGNAVGAVGRWAAFLLIVSRLGHHKKAGAAPEAVGADPSVASVIRVLQQMAEPANGNGDWVIRKIAEASQGSVYTIRAQDRQSIWGAYGTLVVKLYRPDPSVNGEIVGAQYGELSRLHAAMHNRIANGWRICVPKPLYVCESPLALVMTQVPGQTLTLCFETGNGMTSDVLESAARAIVTAMKAHWSRGCLHGDLGFENVLCDISAKNLSFVDPDVTRSLSVENISTPWWPGVRDIGMWLTDIELNGDPNVWQRKKMFFESVLRVFFETMPALEDQERLLYEIRVCARGHLKVRRPPWSPRGWWHFLLGQIISRRIDRILWRVRAELLGAPCSSFKARDCASTPTGLATPDRVPFNPSTAA